MSEFFTRPPEIPEEELNAPRIIPPETAVTRTISTVLMLIWVWWWWNGFTQGAYWIVAAAFIFATGEAMSHWYRPLAPLWGPLSLIVRPVVFIVRGIARLVIPEAYRKPQQVLQPLSFKQINEALDEAAAERDRREGKTPAVGDDAENKKE